MRAVDTNVLVRLMARDDPAQVSAAEEFAAGGVWVSVVALAKAAWVLTTVYELRAGELATAIDMLLKQRHVLVQHRDAVGDALASFEQHAALGFTDCLMLALAKHEGHLPLGTFDRKLGRLDGAERL
jgi:predicted nucleic-acid-binding protein